MHWSNWQSNDDYGIYAVCLHKYTNEIRMELSLETNLSSFSSLLFDVSKRRIEEEIMVLIYEVI